MADTKKYLAVYDKYSEEDQNFIDTCYEAVKMIACFHGIPVANPDEEDRDAATDELISAIVRFAERLKAERPMSYDLYRAEARACQLDRVMTPEVVNELFRALVGRIPNGREASRDGEE